MRRFMFFGCLTLFIALLAQTIDMFLEFMGIKARTNDPQWIAIYFGISLVTHLAITCSPLFRHMAGGKRWLWTVLTIPALLLFSLVTTTISQSAFIKGQAAQIEASRRIYEERLNLVSGYRNAADIQQKWEYAEKSTGKLDKANEILDKAESTSGQGNVKNDDAVTIPLALINTFLPYPLSVEQFLIFYYTMMSFGLVLISYFFGELSLTLFGMAGHMRDMSQTSGDTKTYTALAANEPLTDKHSIAAIDAKLSRGKGRGESWKPADINRSWVYNAHVDMYGKARKGETLDKFIKQTKKKAS